MNSRNKKKLSYKKGSKRRSYKKTSRRKSYKKRPSLKKRRSYRKWEIATNTFDTSKYMILDKGTKGEQYVYIVYLSPYNENKGETRLNTNVLGVFTKVENAKEFLIDLINNSWDPILMRKDDKDGTLTVAQVQIDHGFLPSIQEAVCGSTFSEDKYECPGIILYENNVVSTNKIKNDQEFKNNLLEEIKKIEATNGEKEYKKQNERFERLYPTASKKNKNNISNDFFDNFNPYRPSSEENW